MEAKIKQALEKAWHVDAAQNSLQRWQELSQQENWPVSEEVLIRMIPLFGASWYFTRFCFYRGDKILRLFQQESLSLSCVEGALDELKQIALEEALDDAIEKLRIRKNEVMLSILLLQLLDIIDQTQAEELLTKLAESVLYVMYCLFGLDKLDTLQCIVLAMGRFAGYEMNYGSDLDLIFIEKKKEKNTEEHIANKIRKMLRYISTMDPSGALYEIDMRLRPHGSSGVLVTPYESFLQFHQTEREIWERQMMTRCRVVVGDQDLSEQVSQAILENVYGKYEASYLATEILKMRLLVEQELAGGAGKIEIKRGKGGIMDIDFLTHFFQLAHGDKYPQLKNASTRTVLKESMNLDLVSEEAGLLLIRAYDFYKRSESALRVFDMKSISSVNKNTESLLPLARSLGYLQENEENAVSAYTEELMEFRGKVRQLFESILQAAI